MSCLAFLSLKSCDEPSIGSHHGWITLSLLILNGHFSSDFLVAVSHSHLAQPTTLICREWPWVHVQLILGANIQIGMFQGLIYNLWWSWSLKPDRQRTTLFINKNPLWHWCEHHFLLALRWSWKSMIGCLEILKYLLCYLRGKELLIFRCWRTG